MFATLLIISILLVGPEGAAIFSLLVFQEQGILGRMRRLILAVVTVAIATVAALMLALFGSTTLKHMGIALGAVGILGGVVSVKTGLEPLKIDLLKPFRMQEANEEKENGNKIASEPRGWLRRLANDLTKVFVPIVFPTSVGPAYIAWLVNPTAAGKPLHPPLALLVTAIFITMLVTLFAMTVSLLIGEKMPGWLGNTLARVGGTIFILFGIGTFLGGLNMLT
jgi:small neutral amino acid transporter SnatA (MarC family)